jgi:hypothetical protein
MTLYKLNPRFKYSVQFLEQTASPAFQLGAVLPWLKNCFCTYWYPINYCLRRASFGTFSKIWSCLSTCSLPKSDWELYLCDSFSRQPYSWCTACIGLKFFTWITKISLVCELSYIQQARVSKDSRLKSGPACFTVLPKSLTGLAVRIYFCATSVNVWKIWQYLKTYLLTGVNKILPVGSTLPRCA